MNAAETAAPAARPKNARRISRELAVQALYGWLLNPRDAADLRSEARLHEAFPRADAALFDRLVDGVVEQAPALRDAVLPFLDRRIESLSPVEHAILLLGALELSLHVETPYRVVINEAIDLARTFGGTDGHKYINGILDRLAAQVRPGERRR
ncbi:MAG: transcription antitermination factor NusB [Betaproteobacteria bacterium]|jgi:N utilization substance protein B